MKQFLIFCSFLFIGLSVFAQSKKRQDSSPDSLRPIVKVISDNVKSKADSLTGSGNQLMRKKLNSAKDTLTLSDYMMSIDRVNDNLNSIRDSSNLKFEVVGMGRKVDAITNDIVTIRKNMRGRGSAFSIKNLYLYQSFASDLNDENDRFEAHVARLYNRIYNTKLSMKTVLSDSVFRAMYADSSLRKNFDRKLFRLERKYDLSDSIIKANIDTLNALKVKIADNAVNLSNMLNMMDVRLDRADKQLFGPEVNFLWQKQKKAVVAKSSTKVSSRVTVTKLDSEKNAISFYFSRTYSKRAFVLVLGILLFMWLLSKRKLIKKLRDKEGKLGFLNIQYLNSYPALSLLVLLICLMPFFDAYAPTSYIAIEYTLLLFATTVIFLKKKNHYSRIYWLVLVALLIAYTLAYLLIESTFVGRLWLSVLQVCIIVFSNLFYRDLDKHIPYYKGIKYAAITAMILSGLGIICNLFGRFSLSGIFGISAIFAVTQAVVLPVFIETSIEIILLQLQSSRMKKGFDSPFDRSIIVEKIKIPLVLIAIFSWFIMLASNLNIYHGITTGTVDLLTTPISVGSISFRMINVLYFFVIIWFANIMQQMISFLFGETGAENEDITPESKKRHSRLLITRLIVLIGGYLLAIAASGLPLDKITILLGALGIGIGMGLQNIVNNFVSGIILIFNGSFKIGDEIEVSGQAGKVKEIGLRASTLTTADGADVIIPNGNILSQNIVNWTFTNDQKRVMVSFILSGKEMDANSINEVINDTIKNVPGVISQKKPVILYTKATKENCSLTVRFWSTINNADHAKSEATLQLSAAFADKNIQFS
jgi:potassium-dependent mechanosensitive channel